MSLVINTNSAATAASVNLNNSNAALQKSLGRLSSGQKIVSPGDDAGGLAVSMKMSAAIRRTDAVITNVSNAVSFLNTQEGGLKTVTKIMDRISELKALSLDVTKSTDDIDNYNTEFAQLQAELNKINSEKFNSISLFGGGNLNVKTTEDAGQSVNIDVADFTTPTNMAAVLAAADLSDTEVTLTEIRSAIQEIADVRATNGAQTNRLNFALDMLTVNRSNLEAANSRIIDTDVAKESTIFAKENILVQSGAAMLAQANSGSQIALRLLG